MAEVPEAKAVETEDEYIHVRYRDPDEFETIRTPDWAENAASSVSEGAEVRTGKFKDSDEWKVEAVLIRKGEADEDEARNLADEIIRKIENDE